MQVVWSMFLWIRVKWFFVKVFVYKHLVVFVNIVPTGIFRPAHMFITSAHAS